MERQRGERSRLEAEVARLEGQEREAEGTHCSVQEKVKQLENLCQVQIPHSLATHLGKTVKPCVNLLGWRRGERE